MMRTRTVNIARLLGTFLLGVALFLSATFGLSSCAAQPKESWTVCLYLCGSDLETKHARATNTLAELTEADIPENVTVVVQTGGARTWRNDYVQADKMQRFTVRDHTLEEVDSRAAQSMGSGETLSDFLTFCATEYPADRSAVILWNHGGGPTKGVCFDEAANHDALTLAELDEAFEVGRRAREGELYDIIGLDACLMASLETAATLADDGRYLVASEEIEPGAGWDYAAFMELLGNTPGEPEQIARGICDSYLAKCERNDNESGATLSVVDLADVEAVVSALDGALEKLNQFSVPQDALFFLADGVRSAESFGGSSQEEGQSNLVDLRGVTQKVVRDLAGEGETFEALDAALEEAIVYSVAGSAVADAHGISIYYPFNYEKDALADYAAQTPLSSYASALERLFSGGPADVQFDNAGTVTEEGEFTIRITEDSFDDIYDLYVETTREGDEPFEQTDIYIADDWETGTFYTPTERTCMAIDGLELDAHLVEAGYDENYVVFTAPITVNGEETNLRFSWLYDDDESEEGHYEILGTWNGIDHVTGLSDRSLRALSPGDVVGALSSQTGRVKGEIKVDDSTVIDNVPLAPGTYITRFIVVDLYGAEHPSDSFTWKN